MSDKKSSKPTGSGPSRKQDDVIADELRIDELESVAGGDDGDDANGTHCVEANIIKCQSI